MYTDQLLQLYERIAFLRKRKVKMKDMAERVGMIPSVFSAIYSTVLPAYARNLDKGMDHSLALDEALVWANNVSKRKLLGNLEAMLDGLSKVEVKSDEIPAVESNEPFLETMGKAAKDSVKLAADYCGTYMSYSVSSSKRALKAEPYLIRVADDRSHVEVAHGSAYGRTHWGTALMNGLNHIYIMFNEMPLPQLALFNICLKLPMYDHPPFLRGIYTCLDYNYNPIARRILFVRIDGNADTDNFSSLEGAIKAESELDEREKVYFNYVCSDDDALRMADVQFPKMSYCDLEEEKRLLAKAKAISAPDARQTVIDKKNTKEK